MEEKNVKEKKKYWLKLQKDFLKSNHIKVIKNMPNGKDYIIFYLALMLESIETIGHLRFSDLIPYNEEMLSSITDTNIDIVRNAVKIFTSLGLMEYLDDGTIYMTQVSKMLGKESESAERVRKYRDLKKTENYNLLQCNSDVTKCNDNKEKEKEEEKDKNKYKDEDKEKEKKEDITNENKNIIIDIIEYLNQKSDSSYRTNNNKTISLLNNLLKNYTIEDIKLVIDKKVKDWQNTDMQKFIRPETLFGNKFEGYFNQKEIKETRDIMKKIYVESGGVL